MIKKEDIVKKDVRITTTAKTNIPKDTSQGRYSDRVEFTFKIEDMAEEILNKFNSEYRWLIQNADPGCEVCAADALKNILEVMKNFAPLMTLIELKKTIFSLQLKIMLMR